LSRATLEQEIALGRLAVLDVVDCPILRQWYVVHRRGKRLLPVAQAFKTFLLAEARVILGRRKPGRDDRVDPL
jgi:DNA-binding transcriptional LysR family regulator